MLYDRSLMYCATALLDALRDGPGSDWSGYQTITDEPWCVSLGRYKRCERISAELSSAVSIPGRHENSVTLTMRRR